TYPTGLTKGQIYYVINATGGFAGGPFQLCATQGGTTPISLSGTLVGNPNFYQVTFSVAGTVMSQYSPSWLTTQIGRLASYHQSKFAGTGLKVIYEWGNELWGGSPPGSDVTTAQSFTLGFGVGFAFQTNGYLFTAIADALYTAYGGDKTKYTMLLGGTNLGISEVNSFIAGAQAYLTASGSSRALNQLFDHPILSTYFGDSYSPNGGSVAVTFTNGSPGTATISGTSVGRPWKFHATAGTLPTGLAENTTYWLVGTGSPYNLTATPGGALINLSGGGGTY